MFSACYGCDACSQTIEADEVFFKCMVCPDFLACQECWDHRRASLHIHPFIELPKDFSRRRCNKVIQDCSSVAEIFTVMGQEFGKFPCLGKVQRATLPVTPASEACLWKYWKDEYGWRWYSYKTIINRAKQLCIGLGQLHLKEKNSRVGICAKNRPEWVIATVACGLCDLIWLGIHPVGQSEVLAYILENSQLEVLFCDPSAKFLHLLELAMAKSNHIALKHIIFLKRNKKQIKVPPAIELRLKLWNLRQIEQLASKDTLEAWKISPKPLEAIYCIIYTSGSTGFPKGVMMTHKTWLFHLQSPLGVVHFPCDIVQLCFSPLSHSSSIRNVLRTMISAGRVGFHSGNMNQLMDHIFSLRPVSITATPRFWYFLYEEFNTLYIQALAANENSNAPQSTEQLKVKCFQQIRAKVGGRVGMISIGGAPSSKELREFLSTCFGWASDGFGATEVGGIMVDGKLMDSTQAILIDVPELGYFASGDPPRGQLCVKTPTMMTGYWNDPERTNEAFTPDGFYKTGDICEFVKGAYQVIGRSKFHFKLSSGEFLVPERLESVYSESQLVHQIFIHGLSDFNSPVAIVVPRVNPNSNEEENKKLRGNLVEEFGRLHKQHNLMPHERIHTILLEFTPFSESNHLITASGKPNRPRLIEHYSAQMRNALCDQSESWSSQLLHFFADVLQVPVEQLDIGKGFFESGGDSLGAVRLNSLLRGKVDPSFLQDLMKGKSLESLLKQIQTRSDKQQQTPQDLLASDLRLPHQLLARYQRGVVGKKQKQILLTGATGFVGSFLLEQIVRSTNYRVICLIRGDESRFYQILASYHIHFTHEEIQRVSVLSGDLSETRMGLDRAGYSKLGRRVSHVIHCASWVHFFLPYTQLRQANVIGSWNLLKFASTGGILRPISYISSLSAILDNQTPRVVFENLPLDSSLLEQSLDRGYASTKHVAEVLFHHAGWDPLESTCRHASLSIL